MEMMWWERDGIGLYPTRMAIRSFTRNFLYGYFFRISEGLGKQGGFAGSRWHALFDVYSPIGVGRRQWVLARAMVDLPVGGRVVDRTLS